MIGKDCPRSAIRIAQSQTELRTRSLALAKITPVPHWAGLPNALPNPASDSLQSFARIGVTPSAMEHPLNHTSEREFLCDTRCGRPFVKKLAVRPEPLARSAKHSEGFRCLTGATRAPRNKMSVADGIVAIRICVEQCAGHRLRRHPAGGATDNEMVCQAEAAIGEMGDIGSIRAHVARKAWRGRAADTSGLPARRLPAARGRPCRPRESLEGQAVWRTTVSR